MTATKTTTVLIIEDNAADTVILENKLRKINLDPLELSWYQSLNDGMAAFSQLKPDLIILDLSLPDSAGIQTLIKMREVTGDVPIIIVTGANDEELGIEALRHGAQDYLIKTHVDVQSLNRSIRYTMERFKAQASLRESEEHFRLAFEEAPIGIVVTENWLIARANRVFYPMIGLSPKETIGSNLLEILHCDGNGNCIHELKGTNHSLQPITEKLERRYIKRGNETIWVRVSAQSMKSAHVSNTAVVMIENFTEEKKAEEVRSFLASIIESSTDAIIGSTLDGKIISWNKGASKIYGFEGEEIIGHSEQIIIPHDSAEEFHVMMDNIRKGETLHYQTQRQTKESKLIDVSLTVSPIINPSGIVTGAFTIARDITGHKQMERNAQNFLLMQQRESFMAALAHDLQNPLIGANRVLKKLIEGRIGVLSKEQKEVLQGIFDSNLDILVLVQNLIDVYRREKNVDVIKLMECRLDTIMSDLVKVLAPIAEGRRIQLVLGSIEETTVQGNPLSLRRVFQNLLDNALKFTPAGGKIMVSFSKAQDFVIVEVKNTGEVIPEAHLEKLFDRFWRAPQVGKYLPGTGLGLYICKEIVTAHKGFIYCTSSAENGTAFIIHLPQHHENVK